MASSKQLKARGILLLASFFAVLVAIFMPLFPGVHGGKINGLDYLDNFFNQLSKGSAYYIDKQLKKVEKYAGQEFSTSMKMKSADEAATTAKLFTINNIPAEVDDVKVKVKGDFGAMLTIMLNDADLMYKNEGEIISAKYGINERKALISWYNALSAMEKDLTKAEKFEQALVVKNAMTKAVEPAYNYYKVEAKSVKAEMALLIAALAFYVIYTMWYGFGLLYLFEGIGIKLDH
ncbi:MAG: hypothetical protein PHI97_15210 [Desulfobulbus sp.]|nr:hypothetical protein [Desulfobulbus sp.]